MINLKKQLRINYKFKDYEQLERQKRLEDAFDVIFDDIEIKDQSLDRTDCKDNATYESHR